jgi:sulfate permease, SulP family
VTTANTPVHAPARARFGLPPLTYPLAWFRGDLVAGLTVAAIAVPQGMAYALIAGIPPEYGLYTAIVMTALGSVFGSSSHLINGPTNAISLVVFSAVAGLGLGGMEALRAVFLLSLLVGIIQLMIALFKLGDLTRYVSESVILGFMLGAGTLVALSQVAPLLGLPAQGDGHQHFLHRLWLTLTQGAPVNPACVAAGTATLVLVIGLRTLKKRLGIALPDHLIALLVVSVMVWLLGWDVPTIEAIPTKLPVPTLPDLAHLDWVPKLTGSAFAIALLGLLEALAIAKSISARTRQPLDCNRQCLAEGLANLGGGFFQCMPGSGSLTRSSINYQSGAVTRLSGVFSAIAVGAILLLFAPLAAYLPKAAIAGMLIITAWRLVDKPRTAFALKASRLDAGLVGATAFAAVFLNVEFSILIGTILSFLLIVPRAARLRSTELVVSPERVVRERLDSDPSCGKLVIFDLEGELFFGAGPELAACFATLRTRVEQGARVLILRLKRTRNPDMVCMELFQHFLRDMQVHKVTVLLCGIRPDFRKALGDLGFLAWLPEGSVFEENAGPETSTLKAVRRAYELLGEDLCPTCPRRQEREPERGNWYYMI